MDLGNLSRRGLLVAGAAGLTTAAGLAHATAAAAAGGPSASALEPDIDSTREWGANPPNGSITVLSKRPDKIIVHHTVSANTNDFSRAQAHAHARWVQYVHQDRNGWTDTGYHFVNSRGGWITEGRHQSLSTLQAGWGLVQGAHTYGQNNQAIGIANEGSYHEGATPPDAQWEVLVILCAHVCEQYGIPSHRIYGHQDFGDTLCPGVLQDMLPRLREEVAAELS
ncbi:peptidoglycan recognition family protein [Streptomyces sp. JJ38]|uniref:peptidoglycan recognition protein family protein n=1 Tax=Streptomyces sp. JJ38 TaxID=2738128 RepID=UPI001C562F7E|nr:peptidoglycan recognition family protein [Streptomyces sp. JJ38]MBW1598604.1 N-acetylmuramoyl-L-alanine amidase [Streptomyces sp. JJ38]